MEPSSEHYAAPTVYMFSPDQNPKFLLLLLFIHSSHPQNKKHIICVELQNNEILAEKEFHVHLSNPEQGLGSLLYVG